MTNSKFFGSNLAAIRKDKKLTQRELAERLYVSDKTISKWERGQSLPNLLLVKPIADALDTSITDLFSQEENTLLNNPKLEKDTIQLIEHKMKSQKRRRAVLFFISVILVLLEIWLLHGIGLPFDELKSPVLLVSGLMLIFGGWFSLAAKDILPIYYDEYKINYFTQGVMRMHMPGLSFNNGNWPYISRFFRSYTLITAVSFPLFCMAVWKLGGLSSWHSVKIPALLAVMFILFFASYIIGKKYE